MEKPRNYIIKDVELNWARLVSPQSPFGTSQYEIQIATDDSKKADELIANHIPMKEKDGKFVASLKRKEFKANGESNGKVRVVDGNKQPLDAGTIGNGSTGSIILFQMPYDRAGRQGIMSSLTAVQVTDLVEFSGTTNSIDFDIVGDVALESSDGSDDSVMF
jgi:hypothetical protein|tara:strand:+ start:243 stop:728 length:486 start_codon:yes stop_codon:yes gene_type:complete